MGVVFRDLRRRGAAESCLAGLAAAARTFRQARCAFALSEAAPRQNGVRLRIAADNVPPEVGTNWQGAANRYDIDNTAGVSALTLDRV